ncbi:hypothetical protein XO10_06355 [Marinitoga sp. 1135]|uniref:Putative phosphohydrolase n=1 Tax=Marinitoga piezophila (strain DSM 14283 / JCM 11233 / KA3) TaxID=443254 RepID=H2J303_MARPK|nr:MULTISPECIES: metallophosphoesterase [Marinitoga]AEX85694.1 putative phosphohydrolase [Marinitoga piezophila KA3]APT76146.1 hypothetical protein LN42_06940 [Marinitoga sp. 1137]NUU95899.1 hypothetical protein [Marinitoga sp. 1135]NUU97810.1 hypothetical protein [Marinitoga sp. 1138]
MFKKSLVLLLAFSLLISVFAFANAKAFKVTDKSQLLPGPAADGKVGDYILKNEKVAFLIGQLDNYHGYMKSGGNILDAIYCGGEDQFDEMHTYFGWPKQAIYENIYIEKNGSNGGAAVLKLTGHHSDIPGIAITTTYTLFPGTNYLIIKTTLVNNSGKDIDKMILGDATFFGYARPFTFGLGYKVSRIDTDFIGAQGDKIAYGVTTTERDENGKLRDIHISYIFADPEIKTVAIKNGEKVTFQRIFVVGKDLSSVLETSLDIRGKGYTMVSGKAEFANGKPIANSKVNIFDDKGILYIVAYTDENGNYKFPANPGKYTAKVDVMGVNTVKAPEIVVKGEEEIKADVVVGKYAEENKVLWGPYLSDLGKDSVYINWKTLVPAKGKILINGKILEDNTVSNLHHFKITGLKPGEEYTYSLVVEDGAAKGVTTDSYTFRTVADHPEKFKFVVYADTRTYNKRHRMVADKIAEENPDFVIHVGDLVMDGRIMSDWDGFFWAIKNMAAKAPFYPVLGNHEYNSKYYFSSFVTPQGGGDYNEQYYSFDYGNAHFVVLDADILLMQKDKEGMERETQWLINDLEKHKDAKWKFVFFHEPFWTNCTEYGKDPVSPTIDYWKPVFEKYGVDIVFNSHYHMYERFTNNKIEYIVTGGGGAPLYSKVRSYNEKYPFTTKDITGIHHFVEVIVDGNQVKVLVKGVAQQTDKKKEDGFFPVNVILDHFVLNKY